MDEIVYYVPATELKKQVIALVRREAVEILLDPAVYNS